MLHKSEIRFGTTGTGLNTWKACIIENIVLIGSRHMHSYSKENMVKCYFINKNYYH